MEGCCRCTSGKYIIMKVISFNDSSIQAYRLGKALTYTNYCCRSTYVYKRLSAKNRSSIQLILHPVTSI